MHSLSSDNISVNNEILKSNRFSINNKTIYAFFLFCLILDFGGAFGIRYSALSLVTFYVLIKMAQGQILIPKNFLITEGFLFLILPLLIVSYSAIVYDIPLVNSLGEITSFAIWIIYLILINLESKDELIKPFKKTGFICSLIVIFTFILIYCLILLGRLDIVLNLQTMANDFRIGFIGLTPTPGGLSYTNYPNVYYRWTMILIPISLLFLKDKKIKFLLIMTSIFLITSTGVILFALLGLAFYLLINGIIKKQFVNSFVILFLGFLFLLLFSMIIDISNVTDKLSSDSFSTSIKLGHIESALTEIFRTPTTFLFGMGLGSTFYTVGINEFTSAIEVSHLNLIRQFGILYFILFCSYIFVVSVKLMKTDDLGRMLGISLISFFIAAGTNPLLLSPIFILYLVICRTYLTLDSKEHIKQL
ncbi:MULTISPECIES: hypothetical protein [Bacillus]|uniref:hypothetical protein n=1 Tax=Bacillus TaxID=1386 RepID=UPI00295FE8C8|nr:hypothetical protein [Bacillus cereus]HEF1867556.1 hypothetical protein [Bacillus cereus]HEF1878112.1 hypothetical protein [Bacillus cereus]HEF1884142.1 hypothetical protein [Bacillus cereus]